ncbi:MAG TPA: GntR family transcriptional regulator [Casimicrobiaceae bacterium]
MPPRPRRTANAPRATANAPRATANAPHAASKVRKGAVDADEIASRISTAIVEHRLPPGTKLTEARLGEIFGVSRTKIREALYVVSRSRLVTWLPGRTAFVAQPSVAEAHELFEVRRALETIATRRLARSVRPEQITRLRAQCVREREGVAAQSLRTGTRPGSRLLNDFHRLIAELSGNAVLNSLVGEISARTSLVEVYYGTEMDATCSCDEHAEILACIERGDGAAAARLMDSHIRHIESCLKLEQSTPEAFDLRAAFADNL